MTSEKTPKPISEPLSLLVLVLAVCGAIVAAGWFELWLTILIVGGLLSVAVGGFRGVQRPGGKR